MIMEETDVIIVGAGPSGLALAIALDHHNVKSIILEQNLEICEDPRAIALAGEVHRIVELLGVTHAKMTEIGQNLTGIHFHRTTFTSKPFFSLDEERDWKEQVLPPSSVILQPGLEREFRSIIDASKNADLRLQCSVTDIRESGSGVQATYKHADGTVKEIKASFLVGADGKRGVVRKGYLEAKGIKQVTGIYKYEATWIAANLHVKMPTPKTHPHFPLWKLGYRPEELWDLFWPEGFHFCNHPTMPIATGRFGPKHDRFWRFEYELPPNFTPSNTEEHLRGELKPHLTIAGSRFSQRGMSIQGTVEFPWDCITVLRCAPANFTQRVVNKWFHNNVILIGDAAHVFPPFGAQGIANGVQDAFALSWRLALLCNKKAHQQLSLNSDRLLGAWSRERRKGVDDGSRFTAENGNMLLTKSSAFTTAINLASGLLDFVPSIKDSLVKSHVSDASGFRGVEDGFFLESQGGGVKIAQIGLKSTDGTAFLSDQAFWKPKTTLTLLLLQSPNEEEAVQIKQTLKQANLPSYFLSNDVVELGKDEESNFATKSELATKKSFPATAEQLSEGGLPLLPLYDPASFRRRFQSGTRYALVRPDYIVFSQAQSPSQLLEQLQLASTLLQTK